MTTPPKRNPTKPLAHLYKEHSGEHYRSIKSRLQEAWNEYNHQRMSAEEFACLVATIEQLDNE